ncbi:MAG: hypothetical protein JSU82_17715 [Rhodospirillales bacterium]|nr:MAG: hypothetical protein JSU82_17715 [Rhodospirillales bacterium]
MTRANRRRRALTASIFACGLVLLAGTEPAIAAEEFRVTGGELVCGTNTAPSESGVAPYGDCLQIGPVRIGETLRDVAMRFGRAGKTVRQGSVTYRVWPVNLKVPPGTSLPYWVIGFDDNRRVVSIQLTGDRPVDRYDFSSLRLGDPEDRVREILGDPSDTEPVPQVGAEMWVWRPYPVTLEIKNGRVYSMRVTHATGP